jgi:hypothetical protein
VQVCVKYLADVLHMRFAEDLVVIGVDLVDFYTTRAPCTPSHLRVIDVVVRLLGTFEQHDWCMKSRLPKVLGPVRFCPGP